MHTSGDQMIERRFTIDIRVPIVSEPCTAYVYVTAESSVFRSHSRRGRYLKTPYAPVRSSARLFFSSRLIDRTIASTRQHITNTPSVLRRVPTWLAPALSDYPGESITFSSSVEKTRTRDTCAAGIGSSFANENRAPLSPRTAG